jgi:hypothetical protein
MRHHPATLSLTAVALALVVAGCGISNPYTQPTATTHAVTSTAQPRPAVTGTDADPTPERGGTIPSNATRSQTKLAGTAGAATPQAALERYAQLYVNWTAASVAAEQRRLASISLDSARAQALQAAASYEHDATLIASHVTNTGTVVSIAPGQGAAAGQWVVVTSETTSGQGGYQGLPPELHVTYAQLTHTRAGWVVSEWSSRT